MGTNYYAIPKVDESTKEIIRKAIDEDKWSSVLENIPKRIHIGKSSSGWQFLFNHNDWTYFDANTKSLTDFIKNCEIHNEYRDAVTCNQFWVMVDRKSKEKPELQYGKIYDGFVFSNWSEFS